jgi:hypothetical protein
MLVCSWPVISVLRENMMQFVRVAANHFKLYANDTVRSGGNPILKRGYSSSRGDVVVSSNNQVAGEQYEAWWKRVDPPKNLPSSSSNNANVAATAVTAATVLTSTSVAEAVSDDLVNSAEETERADDASEVVKSLSEGDSAKAAAPVVAPVAVVNEQIVVRESAATMLLRMAEEAEQKAKERAAVAALAAKGAPIFLQYIDAPSVTKIIASNSQKKNKNYNSMVATAVDYQANVLNHFFVFDTSR